MDSFIKRNINIILSVFILIQPVLDLITGVFLHVFNTNFTLGIIIKILFLMFIMLICVFIFKKKRLIIPYLLIGIYGILYSIGMVVYKDSSLFIEIQNLVKVFYFPILLISLYAIRDNIKVSRMTLFVCVFTYIILIFIPTICGVGFASYEITKSGTLGFYNSANEISGIISILTPIIFIIFVEEKSIVKKIILTLIYLLVILMMGTKTPLLTLGITIGFTIIYLWFNCIKKKEYKKIIYSFIVLVFGIVSLIIVIPKTNFYKNIEVHLDYLGLDNVYEVFQDEKLIDHFIFSSRLSFLNKKGNIYGNSPVYLKMFGIGYVNDNKVTKMIEMDYFDIFYSHGIVGFLLVFGLVIPILYKILINKKIFNYERCMFLVSFFLVVFLAFFTGHIITAPSVSLIAIIIILYLDKRKKKDLLFTAYNLDLGGIETALITLLDKINYDKYNVTVILEQKKGIFLSKVNKKTSIKELKVSSHNNPLIRKIINYTRKLVFKVFNYRNYDFSCCYATYSLSGNALATIASNNTTIYIHNNYLHLYHNDIDKVKEFFDIRHLDSFLKIIFVANESMYDFLNVYPEYKNKCLVANNFVNNDLIVQKASEKITEKKSCKKLFVSIGRLDEHQKRISRMIALFDNLKNEDVELWIIGDGPDRKLYEEDIKKRKLKNIKLLGRKSNPYPYIKLADYVFFTSDYEGFPVTYLESIVLKTPIITTVDVSDDEINIGRDYATIIPIEEKEMIKKVKETLKEKEKVKEINLEEIQKVRMKKLEKIFDEVI